MVKFNLKVNNEHSFKVMVDNVKKFSIIAWEATIYKSISGQVKYTFKTKINKVLVHAKALPNSNLYKSKTSLFAHIIASLIINTTVYSSRTTAKMWAKLRTGLSQLIYKSNTTIRDKFLVKLAPNVLRYKSNTSITQVGEKLTQRTHLNSNIYRISTNIAEKMFIRCGSILTFGSKTTLGVIATLRAYASNVMRSNSSMKYILGTKDSSQTAYKSNTSCLDKIGSKAQASVSYVHNTTMALVPKVLAKLGIENSSKSSTSIDDKKVAQYYTVRLNTYTNKKLTDVPQDLFSFCYVRDKNWMFISKMYKSWLDLSSRVASWGSLKE